MFTIKEVVQPETGREALELLLKRRNNALLGGSTFLRMGSRGIHTAIDLSKLNLHYIREQDEQIEIGAMTTLRELETHPLTAGLAGGVLAKAVGGVIGVQFRNVATVGASVYSRYGFSDILTALSVLDTSVELVRGGRLPLAAFLCQPLTRDVLTAIIIRRDMRQAAYHSLRNSASDYPVLNAAVSRLDGTWRVAVGARPNVAAVAEEAGRLLSGGAVAEAVAAAAAEVAAGELGFGANMRGSAAYRKDLCRVLVKRAVMEVLTCK